MSGAGGPSQVALDATRLPKAAEYLATLPEGLKSFPNCKVRDITVEPYARAFGSLAGEPGLPAPVADMLGGRAPGTWHPEVVFQVAHLVVRDRAFEDDASFFAWILNANSQMFDKPILRNLMRLVSPTLVVLGATKRWATFHVGSELAAERVVAAGDRSMTRARLEYPAGLFPRVFLTGLEQAFMAALLASRARDPQVKLAPTHAALGERPRSADAPTSREAAEYEVSWRA